MSNGELKGKTLTVDLFGCNIDQLTDVTKLYDLLVKLPTEIGMTLISAPTIARWDCPQCRVKYDWGYSGSILFAESHMYFHTWPERGAIWVDITTCKAETLDDDFVVSNLRALFGATEAVQQVVPRRVPGGPDE